MPSDTSPSLGVGLCVLQRDVGVRICAVLVKPSDSVRSTFRIAAIVVFDRMNLPYGPVDGQRCSWRATRATSAVRLSPSLRESHNW